MADIYVRPGRFLIPVVASERHQPWILVYRPCRDCKGRGLFGEGNGQYPCGTCEGQGGTPHEVSLPDLKKLLEDS